MDIGILQSQLDPAINTNPCWDMFDPLAYHGFPVRASCEFIQLLAYFVYSVLLSQCFIIKAIRRMPDL